MTCEKAIKVLKQMKIHAAYAIWEDASHESIEMFNALTIAINSLKNNSANISERKYNKLATNVFSKIIEGGNENEK